MKPSQTKENMMAKNVTQIANFIKLWYSPNITTINEFIEAAHNDDSVDFTASDDTLSDSDSDDFKKTAADLRVQAVRMVLGDIDRSDPDAINHAPFGETFAVYEERRVGTPKWHIRQLPKAGKSSKSSYDQKKFLKDTGLSAAKAKTLFGHWK
jgi:hypothetical protein